MFNFVPHWWLLDALLIVRLRKPVASIYKRKLLPSHSSQYNKSADVGRADHSNNVIIQHFLTQIYSTTIFGQNVIAHPVLLLERKTNDFSSIWQLNVKQKRAWKKRSTYKIQRTLSNDKLFHFAETIMSTVLMLPKVFFSSLQYQKTLDKICHFANT